MSELEHLVRISSFDSNTVHHESSARLSLRLIRCEPGPHRPECTGLILSELTFHAVTFDNDSVAINLTNQNQTLQIELKNSSLGQLIEMKDRSAEMIMTDT